MRNTLALIAIAFVSGFSLSACSTTDAFDDVSSYVQIVSPRGYRMTWVDRGTVSTGLLTRERIGELLDEGVVNAVKHLARYGASEDQVRKVVQTYELFGYDHFQFKTTSSPVGTASGMHDRFRKHLYLSLWNFIAIDPADPWPTFSPLWCRAENHPRFPGKVLAGIMNIPFPSTGHEIGHSLFGDDFEHWPSGDPRYR